MVSMGFEFDAVETLCSEGTSITMMQCYATVNGHQVKELPFRLTVSERAGRVVGSIIYEVAGTTFSHWMEEENEDDFFERAITAVEDWLWDGSKPGTHE